MPSEKSLIRITCILVSICILPIMLYFFVKYVAVALLPFVVAWSIASSLRNAAGALSRKAKMPESAALAVITFALAVLIFYLAFTIVSVLIREGKEIYYTVFSDSAAFEQSVSRLSETVEGVISSIPYFGKSAVVVDFVENFDERILSLAAKLVPEMVSFLGGVLARCARAVPYAALSFIVTVIASFYFSRDLKGINRGVVSIVPKKQRRIVYIVKKELFGVIFGYLRAYSLIILLTFTELFTGLSVIGVKYAFLLSFLISLLDVLPVLGAGTVLIPWGVSLVVFGDTIKGVSILVLYGVMTIIRQLAEPKIIGGFLGLHPLCTLAAIYLGAKFLGFVGIFLFPISFIVIRNVFKSLYEERCDGDIRSFSRSP